MNSRIFGLGILDFYYRNSSFSLGVRGISFLGILEFPVMRSSGQAGGWQRKSSRGMTQGRSGC